MSRSPLDYCRHIVDETVFLIEQSGKLDEASFSSDPVAQRAFVRSLEIIGEARSIMPNWQPDAAPRHKMK